MPPTTLGATLPGLLWLQVSRAFALATRSAGGELCSPPDTPFAPRGSPSSLGPPLKARNDEQANKRRWMLNFAESARLQQGAVTHMAWGPDEEQLSSLGLRRIGYVSGGREPTPHGSTLSSLEPTSETS